MRAREPPSSNPTNVSAGDFSTQPRKYSQLPSTSVKYAISSLGSRHVESLYTGVEERRLRKDGRREAVVAGSVSAAASSMLPALAPILFFNFSAHAAAIPGFRFVVPAGSPPLKGSEGGSPSAGTNCTSRVAISCRG